MHRLCVDIVFIQIIHTQFNNYMSLCKYIIEKTDNFTFLVCECFQSVLSTWPLRRAQAWHTRLLLYSLSEEHLAFFWFIAIPTVLWVWEKDKCCESWSEQSIIEKEEMQIKGETVGYIFARKKMTYKRITRDDIQLSQYLINIF